FWSRLWRHEDKQVAAEEETVLGNQDLADAETTEAIEANGNDEAKEIEVKEEAKAEVTEAKIEAVETKKSTKDASKEQLDEVKALVDTISVSSDYRIQAKARDELIKMGPSVAPEVLPMLDNYRPVVRILGILILRDTMAEEAYPALLKLLDDDDRNIRYHASLALVKMTNRSAGYHYNDLREKRLEGIKRWGEILVELGHIKDATTKTAAKQEEKKGEDRYWWKNAKSTEEGGKGTEETKVPWWRQATAAIKGAATADESREKKEEAAK
ncbi:MAG: hypothetical protein JXR97_15210, partial [Planctomycetes bacterium]|nr:hypothetical protein [Planctomycetota bacterium]